MVKTIVPIFIARTRSFWLGMVPAALTLIDVLFRVFTTAEHEPVAAALAAIIEPVFGWSGEQIGGFMRSMAPLYAFIIAQQRAGLTRPYTLDPEREREIQRVVEDGKSAFEAGLRAGEAVKAGKS